MSLAGDTERDYVYGEHWEGDGATSMVRDSRFKLIYYAAGNLSQLFDLEEDPREMRDLGDSPEHADVRKRLTGLLVDSLYGEDLDWVEDGQLVGMPPKEPPQTAKRTLGNQRGYRFV